MGFDGGGRRGGGLCFAGNVRLVAKGWDELLGGEVDRVVCDRVHQEKGRASIAQSTG